MPLTKIYATNISMSKIDSTSFKSVYYTKAFVYPKEVSCLHNNPLIEQNPNKRLVQVVEKSEFFNDLSKKTDVFVASYIEKNKNSFFGVIKALFKDPYHPNQIQMDELNIQTTGFSEPEVYNTLEAFAKQLPLYNKIKGNKAVGDMVVLDNKGYLTIGF